MAVWKISEDVFYVGVNDTTLDLFESQYRDFWQVRRCLFEIS